jgi:hypothetical protein
MMSFFAFLISPAFNFLQIVYSKASKVSAFPKRVPASHSSATLRRWAFAANAVYLLPGTAIIGGFFVYNMLTESYKWSIGLPSTYIPTADEAAAAAK